MYEIEKFNLYINDNGRIVGGIVAGGLGLQSVGKPWKQLYRGRLYDLCGRIGRRNNFIVFCDENSFHILQTANIFQSFFNPKDITIGA